MIWNEIVLRRVFKTLKILQVEKNMTTFLQIENFCFRIPDRYFQTQQFAEYNFLKFVWFIYLDSSSSKLYIYYTFHWKNTYL